MLQIQLLNTIWMIQGFLLQLAPDFCILWGHNQTKQNAKKKVP